MPDGAYHYCNKKLEGEIKQDHSYDKVAHRMKRIDLSAGDGFKDIRHVDGGLDNQSVRMMSKLTQHMMQSIDYEAAAQRRIDNYRYLHEAIGKENNIELPLEDDAVPMVYT